MKNTFKDILLHWAIFLLCMFSFSACQDDGDFRSWDGVLRMEIDAMSIYTVSGTDPSDIVFNIKSNTPWNIISSGDWCKPTPAASENGDGSTVTVTFDPNENLKSRTATLTIKADGVLKDKVITITQEAKELFVVRPYEGLVPNEGATVEFGIKSNKPWVIKTSSPFLANMNKRTGEGSETGEEEIVKITIPKSESIKRRTGTINVSTDVREISFEITQDGYYIEVDEQTPIIFSGIEGEKIVNVKSNVDWIPEVPEEYTEWMTAGKISNNEMRVVMKKENSRFISRTGLIKLLAVDEKFAELNTEAKVLQDMNFTLTGCAPDENGNVRVASTATVIPTYNTKKGHFTFDFEEVRLSGTAAVYINFKSSDDNGSFRLVMDPSNPDNSGLWSGGTIGYHAYTKTPFTYEQINAMRKLEFYIEDSGTPSKINIRVVVDGTEVAVLENRNDIWKDAPDKKGMVMTAKIQKPAASDYFVLKSLSREVYE